MPLSSATGGYLAPTSPPVAYDTVLEKIFHDLLVGISGLAGQFVRPAWQPKAPLQPGVSVDWCAFGISAFPVADYPQQIFNGVTGVGQTMTRHEDIKVLLSVYGPNASANTALIRDGLYLAQNREVLGTFDISFIEAKDPVRIPDLINAQWIQRVDCPLYFRRPVSRAYNILNIASTQQAGTTSATNPYLQYSF